MYDPVTLFIVFLAGIWIASKLVLGSNAWMPAIIAAAIFAFLLPGTGYMLGQDSTMAIAILAVAVGAAQWLFRTSLVQSGALVVVTWLVGSVLVKGF